MGEIREGIDPRIEFLKFENGKGKNNKEQKIKNKKEKKFQKKNR